jgi:FMN phosphatase YigB (HAD superfamily)
VSVGASPDGGSGPHERGERPVLTVDIDGVVARPVLGVNIGLHREFLDPSTPGRPAVIWPEWVARPWDLLRYSIRRPLPEARDALARLAGARRLVAVTGRRTDPSAWLRRHGIDGYFERVVFNEGLLRSPHYKLVAVRDLGAREHVEDDPRTAQLLATEAGVRVYLRDWPRNRGLPYDECVTRIRDLGELADRLVANTDRA